MSRQSKKQKPEFEMSPIGVKLKMYPSGKFNLTFSAPNSTATGLTRARLRFPLWWADVLREKLRPAMKRRAGT